MARSSWHEIIRELSGSSSSAVVADVDYLGVLVCTLVNFVISLNSVGVH